MCSNLCEISRIDKSLEMGSEFVGAKGWGQLEDWGGGEGNRISFPLWGRESSALLPLVVVKDVWLGECAERGWLASLE